MRDPGILDPRHFFARHQALFDNLWRFMCSLGTFLGKSRDLRVYFGKMLLFTRLLGTFLGKISRLMCFFRHIPYVHFLTLFLGSQALFLGSQALFSGSQAPKTFMQAWSYLQPLGQL